MIAYSWPPFDPTSVIPAPPPTADYWKSKREQVQWFDTIAPAISVQHFYLNTPALSSIKRRRRQCVLVF